MAESMSGAGLLYVNSKIVSNELSPELFTKWYQDIHIRDIFYTSGINSAFRYYTRSSEPAKVERPYLALYPLRDVGFLTTAEFKAIPVASEMLPAGANDIFDLADFDTRYYISVGDNHESEVEAKDASAYITSIQFDLLAELDGAEDSKIVDWYRSQYPGLPASSIRLYKLYFQRQNRNPPEKSTLPKAPKMLALHEFASEEDSKDFSISDKASALTASFKLLRSFHKSKGSL